MKKVQTRTKIPRAKRGASSLEGIFRRQWVKRHAGITRRGLEAMRLKSLGCSSKNIAEKYGATVNNVDAWISGARKRLCEDPAAAERFT